MIAVTVTNPNHDAGRLAETTEHTTMNDALERVDELADRYRIRGCHITWQPDGRIIAHDPRRAATDVVIEIRSSTP